MAYQKRMSSKKLAPEKNSDNSWRDSDDSDDPTTKLLIKVKNLKQNFIGDYVGRELVKHKLIPEYKDIVIVDKDQDIIPTLDKIYNIFNPQSETTWLGITRTTIDDNVQYYKLWVNLNEVPIGKHRFQLRAVKASESSIQLQLKVLNQFEMSSSSKWNDIYSPDDTEMNTYHNLCGLAKFTAVLLMSILTLAGNLLWYLGDYSLKLTGEFIKLIQVMTPIIFGILDFLSKCVGGFYWLLYMMWRGDSPKSLQYLPMPSRSIVPSSHTSKLAITPSSTWNRRS